MCSQALSIVSRRHASVSVEIESSRAFQLVPVHTMVSGQLSLMTSNIAETIKRARALTPLHGFVAEVIKSLAAMVLLQVINGGLPSL